MVECRYILLGSDSQHYLYSLDAATRPRYTYILTYLLTPWSRVLFEKLTGSQLVKKFPAFYETQMFITAFTSTRHLSLSWARSIQSMPPSNSLKIHFNINLPSTPGFSKCFLPLRFPHQNPVHTYPLPPYVLQAPPILFFSIGSPE